MEKYYIITNRQGEYIGRQNAPNGKYIQVGSKENAFIFASPEEANKVFSNNLSKKVKKEFFVTSCMENEVQSRTDSKNSNITKEELIKQLTIDEDLYDSCKDFVDLIKIFKKVTRVIDERFNDDSKKLSEIDRKIVDIEHYIEFGKFNAADGYKAFKMLQNALKERRVIKNDRECINLLRVHNLSTNSLDELEKSVTSIANGEKFYTPRVLNELFEV